jgi:hypothetical protein
VRHMPLHPRAGIVDGFGMTGENDAHRAS